jgi:hypothetical protein
MIKQQLQSIEPALQPGDQVHKTVSYAYSLTKSGVAVEKVAVQNFAEIPSRQDAPQTTSLLGLTFSIPQISLDFWNIEFFNTHRRLHSQPSQ